MATKKKNDVVVEGVSKVFEDTPYNRSVKCLDALKKQITMGFNRLELIAKHMEDEDFFNMMNIVVDLLKYITERAITIRDDKKGWNDTKEVINDDQK